jgi:hypothetical protein
MSGKASAAILALFAGFLLLSIGCNSETERENPTPGGTEDAPLSRESAIELVVDHFAMISGFEVDRFTANVDPSTAKADLMTEVEAKERIWVRSGGPRVPPGYVVGSDRLVWLVEMEGEFAYFEEGVATPGPGAWAGTVLAIVTMDGLVESTDFLPDSDAGH